MYSNIRCLFTVLLAGNAAVLAGPYPDAADLPGTTAIAASATVWANWANGHSAYQPGAGVDATWQTPAKANGPATDDVFDIVSLGNGGSITLFFPHPVCDGPGADFAVFENGLNDWFLELAFVEVSSDGNHFFRFPCASLTAGAVGPYDPYGVDPTEVDGLAGKYRAGFGTPFDLAALPDNPSLDKTHIRFIRVVDIIGDGSTLDSSGRRIYDPTPTVGSGGFDLEAIGVIHQNTGGFAITEARLADGGFALTWESNPGSTYQIEASTDLILWSPLETAAPAANAAATRRVLPVSGPRRFYRVGRSGP